MVYYLFHCMFLHVCPGKMFILDSRLAIFFAKKLFFWLSAGSILVVVPLL